MPVSHTISNSDNVIDSRDVIKRIEELEAERTDLQDRVEELKAQELEESAKPGGGDSDTLESLAEELDLARTELSEWETSDEAQELKVLQALAEEASGSADWKYGEALIRDSYFEDYARELAEGIGAIKHDMGWPYDHIDWDAAADALKMDYTGVDFDGVEYWIRS